MPLSDLHQAGGCERWRGVCAEQEDVFAGIVRRHAEDESIRRKFPDAVCGGHLFDARRIIEFMYQFFYLFLTLYILYNNMHQLFPYFHKQYIYLDFFQNYIHHIF